MEPAEPCGSHLLPPHHRPDPGPGDCPPYFRFLIHWRTASGRPRCWVRWAPGVTAAEQAALRELIGRYGPFGVEPGSVSVGAPKRLQLPVRGRTGLFDPREVLPLEALGDPPDDEG